MTTLLEAVGTILGEGLSRGRARTGVAGEALGLRWEDVDLEAGELSVRRTLERAGADATFTDPTGVAGRWRRASFRFRPASATLLLLLASLVSPASAQTFERVETRSTFGHQEFVAAVADLNGDGFDDVLWGGGRDYWDRLAGETARDRLVRATFREYAGNGDGTFRHAPRLIDGAVRARNPVFVVDDFNGDGRDDLAMFDAGVYVWSERLGYGNPPLLFLSRPRGSHRRSHALAHAVRREHRRRPPEFPTPNIGDLHIKWATSGDIDGDGDVDLWVYSSGGANVEEHFVVNNGNGTFTLDPFRVTHEVLHNSPPDHWGYGGGHFFDADNDGDLDLVLGQGRDTHPLHVNQFSVVLVNDGAGYFPLRIDLPRPDFYRGFTTTPGLTDFDLNDDGLQDLLVLHERNDDISGSDLPFTGRYIQALVNDGGQFVDETVTWLGRQRRTRRQRRPNGEPLVAAAEMEMHDVNRDGCLDLVMTRNRSNITAEAPLVYRNNGSGQFRPIAPSRFVRRFSGGWSWPANLNADGMPDFVFGHGNGASSVLVALLNRTPPRPVRCGQAR